MEEGQLKKKWEPPEVVQVLDVAQDTENAFAAGNDLALLAS